MIWKGTEDMATYKLKGTRYLRKYTAEHASPVYAAAIDAQKIVDSLCDVPWQVSDVAEACMTYHTNDKIAETGKSGYDSNVELRERFDAALWCAQHEAGQHRAYANAACYVMRLPYMASYPSLTSLKVRVTSDPYNSQGARIAVHTNSTGAIPTNCTTARTGDAYAEGVAKRTTQTVDGTDYWYPTVEDCTIEPDGGLQLQRYILVVVALESYSTVRGNWLEGCSYIDPVIEIETDGEITGWDVDGERSFNVARGGVYQSVSGAVSGMYCVEVLRNGDDLDEKSFTSQTVPAALSSNMALIAGTSTNLRSGYDANVCFSVNFFNQYTSMNLWRQEVLIWADSTFWNYNYYGGIASQVLRTIAKDGTNATNVINMRSMTSEDVAAGVAFAWVEGKINSASRRVHAITRNGVEIVDQVVPQTSGYWSDDGGTSSNPAVHTRTTGRPIPVCIVGSKPIYLSNNAISGDGLSSTISVVGTITAIRSRQHLTSGSNTVTSDTLVISGNLTNVGGVVCKNCAIVTISGGSATISRPSWDESITPDVYDGFCVSPVHPILTSDAGATTDDGGYVVTGVFTKLGTTSAQGCALLSSSGTITPKYMPGTSADLHSVDYMLAISGGRYFYRGRQASQAKIYPSSLVQGLSNITDEQSCIGLRALYAKLYTGGIKMLTVTAAGSKRYGAGFVVGAASKTVHTVSGSAISSAQVAIYRMSLAATAVPFSVPITFQVKRVKIDWSGWSGTATGGKFSVWMKRGEYSLELPDSTLKKADMYIGNGNGVDGWEYLGSIDATLAGSDRTWTFNLSTPLTSRVATIMLTAFVDMDSVNPNSETTMPQGVATGFSVDPVSGETANADTLWAPDITLLG